MKRLTLAASVVAAVWLAPGVACADEASDTATARALGIEGVALAEAGKCREATVKLERAEKLRHAPTTATRLAECEIALGRIVAGTERLQRVVREVLPPNAHPAFVAAVARAQRVLEANVGRIASLHLSISAPEGTRLSVVVDEDELADAGAETDRRLDPGTHAVRVTAPGFFASSTEVTLAEGESRSLTIQLTRDPSWREPVASSDAAPVTSYEPAARTPSRAPVVLAFAVGGAGLATGIIAGLVTANKASALDAACGPARVCPDGYAGDIDAAKRAATISTAGFVTAGVGTLAGVVLLLATPSRKVEPVRGAVVRPTVGLGSVGIDGRF